MFRFLILFLLCSISWATETSRVPSRGKTIIISTDNELADEFLTVSVKRKEENSDTGGGLNALPTPAKLEEIYDKVGIKEYLSDMDQMDKDIFVLKVKKYSLERVAKSYPEVPKEKIKSLRSY